MEQVKRKLEECLAKFREDKLTEQDLLQAIENVESTNRKEKPAQRLLYLQAENTKLTSIVEGMSFVDENGVHDGPDNPEDWPYQTVHEAILDGWRVLKFPEMAMMMVGEQTTFGVGCEFILEK
tara:strand:+ start:87 stop:455 length:369 start_codon:yes stop_codon:yes gene_type:complete